MVRSIALKGEVSYSEKDSSPDLTNRQVASDIQGIIGHHSRAELASAAGVSKETSKEWITGEGAPSAASLMKLGRRFPEVRRYVRSQMGEDEEMIESPKALSIRLDAIERAIALESEEGGALRALASGKSRAEARARRQNMKPKR